MTTGLDLIGPIAALQYDTAFVHWTQAEWLEYLNQGQRKVVELDPNANNITVTLSLVAGTLQTTPTDCIAVVDVPRNILNSGADGRAIRQADYKLLSNAKPDWPTDPASITVLNWLIDPRSKKQFYVYPPQPASPGKVQMLYSQTPPNLSTVNDTLTLQDQYRNAIFDYMLFRAYGKGSKPGNEKASQDAYSRFIQAVTGQPQTEGAQAPKPDTP